VVLNEEGVYRLYDLQGAYTQYSLGSEAADAGIMDARIYENGMVAMTGSLTFMEVKGWEGGNPLNLANPGSSCHQQFAYMTSLDDPGLSQPPHVWSVIPPDLGISRHVEVLLSVDTTIVSLDTLSSTDQRLGRGPFTHIAPSPNGKSLTLLTSSGMLWVVSSDLQRNLAEFDTHSAGATGDVRQVEWCGNDAILVTWDTMALLVGPFGDTLRLVSRMRIR
jgi:vacuolar protein sorting-associated protein 16